MLLGSLFGAPLFKMTAIMSQFYFQCFSPICSNIKICNASSVTIMLFFHHNQVHMLILPDTINKRKYLYHNIIYMQFFLCLNILLLRILVVDMLLCQGFALVVACLVVAQFIISSFSVFISTKTLKVMDMFMTLLS